MEHFTRTASDFEEVLLYAAVVAHEKATGAEIPRVPEGGLLVRMEINGVEVNVRHFLAKLKEHFDGRNEAHDKELRREAALLVKGRVKRVSEMLERVEQALRNELADEFPDVANEIYDCI